MYCFKAVSLNPCISNYKEELKLKSKFSPPLNDFFHISHSKGLYSFQHSRKKTLCVLNSLSRCTREDAILEPNYLLSQPTSNFLKNEKCSNPLIQNIFKNVFGTSLTQPQIHIQRMGILRYERRQSYNVYEEDDSDNDNENENAADDELLSSDVSVSRFGNLANSKRHLNPVDENLRRVGINRRNENRSTENRNYDNRSNGNRNYDNRSNENRSNERTFHSKPSTYPSKQNNPSFSKRPHSSSSSSLSTSRSYPPKSSQYSNSNSNSYSNASKSKFLWRNKHSLPPTTVSYPWNEDEDDVREGESDSENLKRVREPYTAELTLPEDELRRLRSVGVTVRQKVKVGRAGITPGVVNLIHNGWKNSEIVKVRCEGIYAGNMKQTHEELEALTGGLVIWRSGGVAAVYRGVNYKPIDPFEYMNQMQEGSNASPSPSSSPSPSTLSLADSETDSETGSEAVPLNPDDVTSGLGPKYIGWVRQEFPPVDGDRLLTPGIKYRKPYRLIPYGLNPRLSNKELTILRRQARKYPTHFVLSRNRGLEGLAKAIVQLWDRTEIVKVGVKRGIQNTSNERMAEEIKKLTGGILLSRDKNYIVFFRGKDFLPSSIANTLEKRYFTAQMMADEEERYRLLNSPALLQPPDLTQEELFAESNIEQEKGVEKGEQFVLSQTWDEYKLSEEYKRSQKRIYERKKQELMRKIERKMIKSNLKKAKAEEALAKVNKLFQPEPVEEDRETITEEERYMFTKLGRKMKAYLELGVRGVFSGIIENMHLHWKHRELIKILSKERDIERVKETAKLLESQSGGIFVEILPLRKYHALIFYRGKNYSRPKTIRPRNLLTKREALKRAIEDQRRRSLEQHLKALNDNIRKLRIELNSIEHGNNFDIDQDMDSDSENDENLAFDYNSLIDNKMEGEGEGEGEEEEEEEEKEEEGDDGDYNYQYDDELDDGFDDIYDDEDDEDDVDGVYEQEVKAYDSVNEDANNEKVDMKVIAEIESKEKEVDKKEKEETGAKEKKEEKKEVEEKGVKEEKKMIYSNTTD